jgi:hypothetical protein
MSSKEIERCGMLENRPHTYPVTLALSSGVWFFPGARRQGFLGAGEPIYGEVIRDMVDINNRLVPTLNR